jgi:hypothetical protein
VSLWPVIKPPIDRHPRPINLAVKPPEPVTFDGPLNILIALEGHATAYVRLANIKASFIAIAPVPGGTPTDPPPPRPAPSAPPNRKPPGVGSPIKYDKGVLDTEITNRINRPRPSNYD